MDNKNFSLDELLKNGSVTLKAKSRQELYDHAQSLTDSLPKETKWTRTIAQFKPETFEFVQTITIINKK